MRPTVPSGQGRCRVGAEDCFQAAFHWKRQGLDVIGRGERLEHRPRVPGMSDLRQTTSPQSFSRKVESWAPTSRGRGEDKRGHRR